MKSRIKQYFFFAVIGAIGYFLLSNHLIFYGKEVHLLKKTSLNLHYTFFSVKDKKPETILKIDHLREAGIGDLLVELDIVGEEEKQRLEDKFQYEEE
ncbi:MAG: hypothetical protein JSW39_28610 [Desulfobacterales bacterium]|nr:MAG: hypothetical protein JSW39_28610 [Desulfobacterales bacterium]